METIDARFCEISRINFNMHLISYIGFIEYDRKQLYLNHLHKADFSHNRIKTLEKFCFYSLRNGLKTLNLSNNIITDFATEAFSNLVKLETLDMSNNNITNIKRTSFDDLYQLKKFFFANNKLQTVHFGLFKNSYWLQVLNFTSNHIKTATSPDQIFWKNVTTLDLSDNKINLLDMKNRNFILKHFPNLNTVPDNPKTPSTPEPVLPENDDYARLVGKSKRAEIFLICSSRHSPF
jgi:Leucine-rich repeat (LRR) protein